MRSVCVVVDKYDVIVCIGDVVSCSNYIRAHAHSVYIVHAYVLNDLFRSSRTIKV